MGKDKLKRFAENETFDNLIQASFDEVFYKKYKLHGQWGKTFFKNDNPIVLELGCGKGDYCISQSRRFPDKNYIGIDIKGARLWRGAKTATEENLNNVAFIRTRIELINSFFAEDEISEIWVTFPDPQLKKRRNRKRLTSSRFLTHYQQLLVDNGIVHLKTDNQVLHEYTVNLIKQNNLEVLIQTNDLYNSGFTDPILEIKTFYESRYLEQGLPITYLKFKLPKNKTITEPDDEE